MLWRVLWDLMSMPGPKFTSSLSKPKVNLIHNDD